MLKSGKRLVREALRNAEDLGQGERAVGAPHGHAARVARELGHELRRDRAAELAVQAGQRWIERGPDVVDVAYEDAAHARFAVALERARESQRVAQVAVPGRVR